MTKSNIVALVGEAGFAELMHLADTEGNSAAGKKFRDSLRRREGVSAEKIKTHLDAFEKFLSERGLLNAVAVEVFGSEADLSEEDADAALFADQLEGSGLEADRALLAEFVGELRRHNPDAGESAPLE